MALAPRPRLLLAPDQQGGVTALTVVRPNLVANWFRPAGAASSTPAGGA